MGNAFSELNDPLDQKERFVKQVEARRALGDMTGEVDEDFVTALEYGMRRQAVWDWVWTDWSCS